MKNIFVTSFLWAFFIPFAFSQNKEHVDGGHFEKSIEYNVKSQYDGSHNLNSKGEIQKMFFGDFNAPVEFYYLPTSTATMNKELISGFRIVRNSSNILEVKYISNYVEAAEEAQKMYPLNPNLSWEHPQNKTAWAKQFEEMNKLYKIETLSFPISSRFAENLYQKMVSLIDNFKAKGVPPVIFGGYSAMFRNVVEDEVWSLCIDMPNGDALKMSDLCRQIITDALADQLDETKYITVLKTFEN